jgi:hypothetical protein
VKLVDARHATAARIAATERLEVAVRVATQVVQPTAARCAGHGRTLSAANGVGSVAILGRVQHRLASIGHAKPCPMVQSLAGRTLPNGVGSAADSLQFGYEGALGGPKRYTATSRTGSSPIAR